MDPRRNTLTCPSTPCSLSISLAHANRKLPLSLPICSESDLTTFAAIRRSTKALSTIWSFPQRSVRWSRRICGTSRRRRSRA